MEHLQPEHEAIIAYFTKEQAGWRKAQELPFLLYCQNRWPGLVQCLSDPALLVELWSARASEVQLYWAKLDLSGIATPLQAYEPFIKAPEKSGAASRPMALILAARGCLLQGEKLATFALWDARHRHDLNDETDATLTLASLLQQQGRRREAISFLTELCSRLEDSLALAAVCRALITLHEQRAMIERHAAGDQRAAELEQQKADACRQQERTIAQQSSDLTLRLRVLLDEAALTLRGALKTADVKRHHPKAGEALHLQATEIERLAQLTGSARFLADARHYQGWAWQLQGHERKAVPLHERELRCLDHDVQLRANLALANAQRRNGDFTTATKHENECETLARRTGDPIAMAMWALQIAEAYQAWRNTRAAERWQQAAQDYLSRAATLS